MPRIRPRAIARPAALVAALMVSGALGCHSDNPEGVAIDRNAPTIQPDPRVKDLTLENEAEYFAKQQKAGGRSARSRAR